MSDPRARLGSWLGRGLVAGALLGLLEALERSWAVREFLSGPAERLSFAALAFSFCLLTGIVVGLAVAGVAIARAALARLPVPAAAGRVLAGAACGMAAAAWFLFALTLTVRFDRIVARGPLLLAAAAAAGAVAGLVWPAAARAWRRIRGTGPAPGAALAVAFAGLVVLQLWNAHFAPQSSLGIHVLADTALVALALGLASLATPRGATQAAGLVAAAALAAWTDHAMRHDPSLENLIKTRGSISSHAIRLWSAALDFDRDGQAAALLVGGDDPAPFDPRVPGPILRPEAAASYATAAGDTVARSATRPHLLLVTVDALRADAVPPAPAASSGLGSWLPGLPRLDALAVRCASFRAGYTPSAGTEDTFRALFSGFDLPGALREIPRERYLASRLASAGYAVRGFVNDPHFFVSSWESSRLVRAPKDGSPALARAAAAFLDSVAADRPGFVWFHLMDLHAPLLAPFSQKTYSHRAHLEAYARGLARVDSVIGSLVAELEARGLASRTLLVIAADHGEELREHGHYHHNLALYEPAVRVPLWVAGPGVAAGGRAAEVSLQALYPTLLEAAGVEPGPSAGRSLWPSLSGADADAGDRWIYAYLPQRGFSMVHSRVPVERGQAALIETAAGRKVIVRKNLETWEAYDLTRDPLERRNLAGRGEAWPDSLRERLERMIEERAVLPGRAKSRDAGRPRGPRSRPRAATVATARHRIAVRSVSRPFASGRNGFPAARLGDVRNLSQPRLASGIELADSPSR